MISDSGSGSIYTQQFLQKIKNIKQNFAQGDAEKSLAMLIAIEDKSLKQTEIAMKYNLLGVVSFSIQNMEMAISYFEKAITNSTLDPVLTSQISLNLASSYFELNYYEKALTILKTIAVQSLPKKNLKNIIF